MHASQKTPKRAFSSYCYKKSYRFDNKIISLPCLSDLLVRVWFEEVPILTNGLFLGTLLTDCFVGSVFSSKEKMLSRHSHPVAIQALPHYFVVVATNNVICNFNRNLSVQADFDNKAPHSFWVARQTMVMDNTTSPVLATMTATWIFLKRLCFSSSNHRTENAAHCTVDALSDRPFYIIVNIFHSQRRRCRSTWC